ncbi:MAG: hypothetical protein JNK77_05400, partial [Saprospiraceae bacterium]|nr:hypothetical protein [Saprospiraceae bacterium]
MRKYFYLFTICMLIGLANLSAKAGSVPVADSIPAQSIWSKIDLTGKRFKEVLGAPIPRQMRTWPYIVIGGAVVGGGVYLLTNDKDESPPPLPVANDDQAGLPCGTASATINVLANDTGEGLSVSSVTQPTGASVSIASVGNLLISNVGNTGFSFVYSITDQLGRSESATVTINVSDTQAPVITCPPTANVPCGSSTDPSVTGNPTISDNCTPTPQIMVAFSDQAAGDQIMRTWTATDQVGNAVSCVQTISFSDTQAPVITCPPTSNVPCGSSTDPSVTGSPTVSDNCTPTPQIMVAFSDQAAGDQIMRTWTATDLAGNTASCVQTISFSDTQAPVITCPANAVLPAGTPPTPNNTGTPTASDNCTPTPQIALTFSDQSSGTGCSQVIQRTWNATDLAGNTASCVQTISF